MRCFLTTHSSFDFIYKKKLVNYKYYVTLSGSVDKDSGLLYNHFNFQNILIDNVDKKIREQVRQRTENCDVSVRDFKLTGENLAQLVFDLLKKTELQSRLYEVSLCDHKDNRFTYPCQTKN